MRPGLLSLTVLTACVSGAVVTPPTVAVTDRTPTPVAGGDPWPTVATTPTTASPPAWLDAPLATVVVPHEGRSPPVQGPTPSLVRERLCAGDRPMWERYAEALDRAFAAGQPADAVIADLGTLVDGCGDPRICAPALALATQATRPAHVIGYHALQPCTDAGAQVAMTSRDVPARTLAAWWSTRFADGDVRAWVPGLGGALSRLVVDGDEEAARALAVALGATDDRRAAAELLAAWSLAPTPRLKEAVAAGMFRQSDPQAAFVFAGLCARPYVAEPLCDPDARPDPAPADSCRLRFDAAIRSGRLDDPPAEVAACLGEMARADWAMAARVAEALPIGDRAALAPVLDPLRRWPSAPAQEQALRAAGLLTRTVPVGGPRPVDTPGLLEWYDQAVSFLAAPDDWPAGYDGLLWSLASLASPPLDGAAFEMLTPPPGAMQALVDGEVVEEDWRPDPARPFAPEGIYLLRGYLDGRRWEVQVVDDPDHWQVDAALGLLNTMAEATGNPVRWMRLDAEADVRVVVAAPADGLRRALAEGLIVPAGGR